MIAKLLLSFGLMAICVVIHATGLASIFRRVDVQWVHQGREPRYLAWQLISKFLGRNSAR